MLDVHPDGELAPRDVVAREIQNRLTGGEVSYLTLGHLDAAAVRDRFPNLVEGAARAGLDLTRDRLPVSPAAHYLMGGIATGLDGASDIAGLYAVGECASSGVHGANRLASNSLLECFVFSHRAVAAGLDAAPVHVETRPATASAGPRDAGRAAAPDVERCRPAARGRRAGADAGVAGRPAGIQPT